MPDLLLHICCAPCLAWPQQALSGEALPFTGFWYNPNIQPYTEYRARLGAVMSYAAQKQLDVVYHDEYPLEQMLEDLARERCRACYRIRLERTAQFAREQGYRAFSTTLLYSIYQQHDLIRELGEAAGKKHGVEFYYRDFRPGWARGWEIAREMGLYRQKYCGCIFSERDRYAVKNNKLEQGKK